jgi:leucyl-tRNA synthetase
MYNHRTIEQKWIKKWAEGFVDYRVDNASDKESKYILVEFPFPSGAGLHVGHIRSYVAQDIKARMYRMQGQNVLYPLGWDAFGLPTENYAIQNNISPVIATENNINTFKKQLALLGLSFDWSREINTTDPQYYRWTQWIWLQMYKAGLAYQDTTKVWWCDELKTVLANEEVIDGKSERGGYPCERVSLTQWMLAITKYADRLDKDLDTVDYLPIIKTQQRNWIGRSEGVQLKFQILDSDASVEVFTTRIDTLFGVTFLVLAPENPILDNIVTTEYKEVIQAYQKQTKSKSDLDRQQEKEKTGVFTGTYALHPLTGEQIPIWTADYILMNYGTGAVMAVPAHDERDREFAEKFELPIKQVIAEYHILTGKDAPKNEENIVEFNSVTVIVKHWVKELYYVIQFNDGRNGFVGGHIQKEETLKEATMREVIEETGYTEIKSIDRIIDHVYSRGYKHRKLREELCHDSLFVVTLGSDKQLEVIDEETQKGRWVTAEEIIKSRLVDDIYLFQTFFEYYLNRKPFTGYGKLVNSGEFDGLFSEEAKEAIISVLEKNIGQRKIQYKLRDWVFSRQRYWGEPFPIVWISEQSYGQISDEITEFLPANPVTRQKNNNTEYAAPLAFTELPLELPEVESYIPQGQGEGPLALAKDWVEIWYHIETGKTLSRSETKPDENWVEGVRETDTMPNWAGSSWYYLRYADPHNTQELASKYALEQWLPVDLYNGGMEHVTLHLLYSRFWHKFLYDIGVVPTIEPYQKRIAHGMILAEGGIKMSKSKGNTIDPIEMVESFGADALRIYEMFMGPYDEAIAWDTSGLIGCSRFLKRVYKWIVDMQSQTLNKALDSIKLDYDTHSLIRKITEDIENQKYNTCISSLMEYLNTYINKDIGIEYIKIYITLLAPFATHITEELWEILGEKESVHKATWPQYDESKLIQAKIDYQIHINGKMRDIITVDADLDNESIQQKALASDKVNTIITDKNTIKKIIVNQTKKIVIIIS